MIVTIVSGLSIGAIYALVAVGYNLTWLTSRAINFAQGALMVAGMFLTVLMYEHHVPVIVIFIVLAAAGAIIAAVELGIAVMPVLRRGDHAELVTTVGVMTVIQGVILFYVKQASEVVPFFGPTKLIKLPGGQVTPDELLLIPLAIVIGLGAHFWAVHTRTGLAAASLTEDRDAAMVLGVNTRRFSVVAFVISGALGLVVAPFVGPETFAVASLASSLAVNGFVVLAVAGIGSQIGALIGGFGVGVVQQVVERQAGPDWQNLSVFIVFIAVLMIRPRGLFGEKQERVV